MKKRIQMDESTKNYLKSIENIPSTIKIRDRKYFPKTYEGSGYKGVVWKGKDDWACDIAIKFTISEDYLDRSFLQEAFLAN